MKLSYVLIGCAGALFGAGLAVSRMSNPAKVLAFLDVGGTWDPSLAFVLGGAVVSAAIGFRLIRRAMKKPIFGDRFPDPPSSSKLEGRQVLGSAIFGIGWGISGLCPGPAVSNITRMRVDLLLFLVTMLAGMWLARRCFGVDRGA